jgi:hypothetical protein
VHVQRIGQITLANDRTYYYNTDTKDKEFFYTAESNNVAAWETRMLCSHFPVIGGGVGMESDHWTQFSGSGGIRFRHKELTSIDEVKAWLQANPVKIRYVLANPIETALTDAEIVAFKALRSNYPNTTVLNDAGAWMEVAYNADTNAYIKNMRKVRTVDVELLASAWVETEYSNMWAQEIKISGSTKYTKVKLSPTIKQIAVFYGKHLAFDTETVDGVITAYAIGQKPMNDYVIQAEVTEVSI